MSDTIFSGSTEIPESKYRFIEFTNGFRVEADDRLSVTIKITNNGKALSIDPEGKEPTLVGLYQFYQLVNLTAGFLMSTWEELRDKPTPYRLHRWAVNNTARAINKRIHAQWQRLLKLADPAALKVQKAIFAATRNTAELALGDELYQFPLLINDIIQYRAAALATVCIETILTTRDYRLQKFQVRKLKKLDAYYQMVEQITSIGGRPQLYVEWNDDENWQSAEDPTYQLCALQDWRNLFSFSGQPYHNLNYTLMNLPGGVPMYHLPDLSCVELPRPITNRLELSLVLAAVRVDNDINMPIILFSQEDQVKRSIELLSSHLVMNLSHRRWQDIKVLARYLGDFPEKYQGNIEGLLEKSIDWHRYNDLSTPPNPLPETWIPGFFGM